MKRTLTYLLLLLTAVSTAFSQVKEGESALVYYMPLRQLVFEIDYEQVTLSRGIFYQYSERYLGSKDAVLQDEVFYRINSVNLRTRTLADTSRVYTMPLNQKTLANCAVVLNEKGIIECVNLEKTPAPKSKSVTQPKRTPSKEQPSVMPLLEEQMLSGSISKMAETTAKQIYTIRENRLNLLAGDVEHAPADGTAMQLVLQEMNKQEAALTALFIGSRQTKQLTKTITLIPYAGIADSVLFRFSKHEGVVDSDDLSGEPYILNLTAHLKQYSSSQEADKQPAVSYIYQNIPGSADITLTGGNRTLVEKTLPVPQFGIATPLAADLFAKRATQLRFDTMTGAILEIK